MQPSSTEQLPDWREHAGHRKIEDLVAPGDPRPVLEKFLIGVAEDLGKPPGEIRVLDMGCGRGALVARLLAEGWDAWGTDIAPEYIAAGSSYFDQIAPGAKRVRVIDEGSNPFDFKFDVIFSTETIEHVANLDDFCALLADAGKPGTRGFHQWPGRWRPMESHMHLPCVHWLPKGKAQRTMIKAQLSVGLGIDYFTDEPLERRAKIFSNYSEQETFYRSTKDVRTQLANHGIEAETLSTVASWAEGRWPRMPAGLRLGISYLYGQFESVIMTTRQISD